MSQLIYLIFFILTITACKEHIESNKDKTHEKLQGYWKNESSGFTVIIQDSHFYFKRSYSCVTSFRLKNKLLIVNADINNEDSVQVFKLIELKENVIKLALISDNLKEKYGRKSHWPGSGSDTIEFDRIRKKNNLIPVELGFNFGAPMGPSFIYEIGKEKKINFYGRHNVPFLGGNNGSLSQVEFDRIVNEIQNIPFDKIDSLYNNKVIDGALIQFYLRTQDTVIRKIIVGDPSTDNTEFNILLYNLMDFPFRSAFKKNQYVKDDFKFKRESDSLHKWLFPKPPALPKIDK